MEIGNRTRASLMQTNIETCRNGLWEITNSFNKDVIENNKSAINNNFYETFII